MGKNIEDIIGAMNKEEFAEVQNELHFVYSFHNHGLRRCNTIILRIENWQQEIDHQLVRAAEALDPDFPQIKDSEGYEKKIQAVEVQKIRLILPAARTVPHAYAINLDVVSELVDNIEQYKESAQQMHTYMGVSMAYHASCMKELTNSSLYKLVQKNLIHRLGIAITEENEDALLNHYKGFYIAHHDRTNELEIALKQYFACKYYTASEASEVPTVRELRIAEQNIMDLGFYGNFMNKPSGSIPEEVELERRFKKLY